MLILVDQDDVLCEFNKKVEEHLAATYGLDMVVPISERKHFEIEDEYPSELSELIKGVYYSPGFIQSLEPVPGALEAVNKMLSLGIKVFICTRPLSNDHCASEKVRWVRENMGSTWTKRLIMTKDKTLVRGAILIDDNPDIQGAMIPDWEHVLYDKPYNRHVRGKKRLTWANWREVLNI